MDVKREELEETYNKTLEELIKAKEILPKLVTLVKAIIALYKMREAFDEARKALSDYDIAKRANTEVK